MPKKNQKCFERARRACRNPSFTINGRISTSQKAGGVEKMRKDLTWKKTAYLLFYMLFLMCGVALLEAVFIGMVCS